MAQLAIKGHPARGREVIQLLEMLGGVNVFNLDGTMNNYYYYIDENSNKIYHCLSINLEYGIVYTLEEFLEKFPYKVGDKVVNHKYGKGDITQMLWIDNEIVYEIEFEDYMAYCKANELCKYDAFKGLLLQELTEYLSHATREELDKTMEEIEIALAPFKVGDKVIVKGYEGMGEDEIICVFKTYDGDIKYKTKNHLDTHYFMGDSLMKVEKSNKEEKQKLFQAIKDNGYEWNPETKTLEKVVESRFHAGDWITDGISKYQILFIDDIQYWYSENGILGSIESVDKRYHHWTIQDAEDGDVLAFDDDTIVIFKDLYNKTTFHSYCHIEDGVFSISELDCPDWWDIKFKPATKEQRDFLFQKIKEAGYRWNAEIKTLEKLVEPKFKVGDIITKRDSIENSWVVSSVSSEYYGLQLPKGSEGIGTLPIIEQDKYELVLNKFDVTTLVPFESKVLVRDINTDEWRGAFYSHYKSKKFYIIGGSYYYQCIPYEGNEYLLDTTNDCDNYYKNW